MSSGRIKPFQRLEGTQADASHPRKQVWLSASAGTGKTHVLTARVLRLLLNGADPDAILCLTFTKAGAAEMSERIQGRLASWVDLAAPKLKKELFNLGEKHGEAEQAAARRLFARVLDAPGGGLRIQTIHAFAQTLLAGFPAEAGLAPGFRPLDGRAEQALQRATLGRLLVEADAGGDHGLIRDVQALSRRLGEEKAEAYLRQCARAPAAMAALGSREGIEPRVRSALDVPLGDVEEAIAAACHDDAHDCASLDELLAHNLAWGTGTATKRAEAIGSWRGSELAQRAAGLGELHQVWAKADGSPRSFGKGQAPPVPGYADLAMRLHEWAAGLLGLRARAELATLLAAGMRAGQAYARAYEAAKRASGAVDFDDLIRFTVGLLGQPGIGEWIRYKLDRRTDHVLIDEGQDTNVPQWTIVRALAEEFFVEEPSPDPEVRAKERVRTLFSVGDFKQAIFGFQGTDPMAFAAARHYFDGIIAASGRSLDRLTLDRSFRSTPPILRAVDEVIGQLGGDALGLFDPPEPHASARAGQPGTVTLWRPVSAESGGLEDGGDEDWIDDATRSFARKLARQVRDWLAAPLWLEGAGRALRPEDVLVLVRKRGDLASLIVARLHAEGVPVAGVDRLRLDAPLAVKDLVAAMRFALQPDDDLTLASLLVSPLFGLSQDDLYGHAYARKGSLWAAVRDDPAVGEGLGALLATADYTTPHRFLETILSGPLDGRRKLLRRLGQEARDPIDELLNAALAFEQEATPTLQRFLDWFDRGEVVIARDPSAPLDAVRVMTVHGAKGLEAPLVILADATGDPAMQPGGDLRWQVEADGAVVPILRPRKAELAGSLAEAQAAQALRDGQEHWRLLYVALTRAQERLVIGGALGPRARGVPPAGSWYAALDRALEALGAEVEADDRWGGARHFHGEGGAVMVRAKAPRAAPAIVTPTVPGWLHAPAPQEARPPRPLAPSSLGEDEAADPPPTPAMRAAAERGRLLHALFERLPGVAAEARGAVAERWLTGPGGVADAAAARAIAADACRIIADAAFRDLFSPDALAEAPIAAVLDNGLVVSGTVDRLLVEADRVRLVDFKTGRRVPGSIGEVPAQHLRQMAAYVAALAIVFPDRAIEAALLYTSGPVLLPLDAATLAAHKPGFAAVQQKQAIGG